MSQEPELERAVREYQAGINRERNGDLIAQSLRPIVLRFFRKNFFSTKEHEDLTQETLLRVFKRLEAFRFQGSFLGWVFVIASNLLKDTLRHQGTEKYGQLVSLEDNVREETNSVSIGNSLADDRANPEQETLNKELLAIRTEAIKTLSPREFEVLKLKISKDLSSGEIAIILGISEETVRGTLRNARKKVKTYVNDKLKQ